MTTLIQEKCVSVGFRKQDGYSSKMCCFDGARLPVAGIQRGMGWEGYGTTTETMDTPKRTYFGRLQDP